MKVRLLVLLTGLGIVAWSAAAAAPASAAGPPQKTSCWYSTMLCTEVANPQDVWGSWYVGHDEPSALFYSKTAGAGNDVTYRITLPKDPPGGFNEYKSYNFELMPAFWLGMAMCDTQSYPELVNTCLPDSDSNIVDPAKSPYHPGTAFTELQFYPPGWVKEFSGFSCAARQWCAALNIDSYSDNPITGQALNPTCQAEVLGGLEYINYAYLTLNGVPQGPPNPLQFSASASGDPGPNVLYMNPGDQLIVSMHDSANGLVTTIDDLTTGQTGSMTASAANGFGQIKFAPGNSTVCKLIPYDFHPMYSTSSPETRVPWAAHSYNIAFADEIGHFDFCTRIDPNSPTQSCDGMEGPIYDREPADGDDNFCFAAADSLLYPATGCTDANDPGFDGPSYQNDWPNGNTSMYPTPILFSSPTTTGGATYDRVGLEADLPRIEAADFGGTCNRSTGAGCTNPPMTDDGQPATFYPYYSTTSSGPNGSCMWGIGSTLPNTIDDFGGSSTAEYGGLLRLTYTGLGGTVRKVIEDYRNIVNNPC